MTTASQATGKNEEQAVTVEFEDGIAWVTLNRPHKRRSIMEVWGQAVRILLGALGSEVGRVPIGNTGGANVGMFRRMPIDPELAKLLDQS